MLNREMARELLANLAVTARPDPSSAAFLRDVRVDDRLDVSRIRLVDDKAAHFPAALNKAKSRHLVSVAAASFPRLPSYQERFRRSRRCFRLRPSGKGYRCAWLRECGGS